MWTNVQGHAVHSVRVDSWDSWVRLIFARAYANMLAWSVNNVQVKTTSLNNKISLYVDISLI